MDTKSAIQFLNFLTDNSVPFFRLSDLQLWLRGKESDDTLRKSIKRHCATGLFQRIYKNIYLNGLNSPFKRNPYIRYCLANVLRPHDNNWESLESRLSQMGVISQVPNRLTFMTTGKPGTITTAMGTFEFSHSPLNRLPDVRIFSETGIFHATAEQAWKDLQFVGRNLDLVDMDALQEEMDEEKRQAI